MDAMQMAMDKLSVKAVEKQPQACVMCGAERHTYEQCPMISVDEMIEQVNSLNNEPSFFPKSHFNRSYSNDPVEQQNWRWNQNNPTPFNNTPRPSFTNPSGSNNYRNFYQNASFPNQNNQATQASSSKPYVPPYADNFTHEQGKMNQINGDQMQSMSAQLAAQNKLLEQLSHMVTSSQPQHGKLPAQPEPNPKGEAKAITLRSGTQYKEPAILTGQTPVNTTRIIDTRPALSSDQVNLGRMGSTRPASQIKEPMNATRIPDTRPTCHESENQKGKEAEKPKPPPYRPPVPFSTKTS